MLKLGDFLLEFCWVHAFISEGLCVLVDSLEFSLEIFVSLEGVSHVLVMHELVWNLQRHQELGSVSFALQIVKAGNKPIEDMVEGTLFSVSDISHKVRIEIGRITKNFQETTNALFSFLLGFLLHVYRSMGLVEFTEDFVDQLKQLERGLVVEFNHAEMAHEWRLVEAIDNHFDFSCIQIRRFAEKLLSASLIGFVWVVDSYLHRKIGCKLTSKKVS